MQTKMYDQETVKKFNRFKMQSLLGVFIGYMAYYIVRNNFIFSTPYLKEEMNLSATEIGLLSSCMLITYGLSKGFMSVLADKSNPRYFMATGLILCILINVAMGFSTSFYLFVGLVVLLGLCQGMGVGPSIITGTGFLAQREGVRALRGTCLTTLAAVLLRRLSELQWRTLEQNIGVLLLTLFPVLSP